MERYLISTLTFHDKMKYPNKKSYLPLVPNVRPSYRVSVAGISVFCHWCPACGARWSSEVDRQDGLIYIRGVVGVGVGGSWGGGGSTRDWGGRGQGDPHGVFWKLGRLEGREGVICLLCLQE